MSASWTVSAVLLLYFTQERGFARLIYAKIGDSVVLHPGRTFDSIPAITWKHNMKNILVWNGVNETCLRGFIGRCGFDKLTGSLIINNLIVEDTGKYNPEINNKILDVIELWVMKSAPKPTVSIECNKEKTICELTCNANITSQFGPVTFRWEAGNRLLSINMKLSLTMNNKERSYVCKLLNPFSNSSSDPVPNPISPKVIHPAVMYVPIVLLVLILVVIGGFVRHRQEQKKAPTEGEANTERSAVSLKSMRENDSLASIESGPSLSAGQKFSSARDHYLQDDEEKWVQNQPEYRRLSRQLREFRLHRDL